MGWGHTTIFVDHDLPHDHGVWYGQEEPPHGPNNPTYEPTATATTPPSHPGPTRPGQTRPRRGIRPGVTTHHNLCRPRPPHTTTGCGTAERNHPTAQTTRPMSPPQPQPPHRPTPAPPDQTRPIRSTHQESVGTTGLIVPQRCKRWHSGRCRREGFPGVVWSPAWSGLVFWSGLVGPGWDGGVVAVAAES